jgi:hypothetical protein
MFTATVVPASGPAPTGNVIFKDGATTLATVALSSGKAIYKTAALNAGSHSITASYAGSSNLIASTSKVLTELVNKATTTTTLTSSLSPSKLGQAVTFTATIAPGYGGATTGTVKFSNGSATLGTVVVNSTTHKASFTTSALTHGSHVIGAIYSGDSNLTGSAAKAITETVN